MRLNNPLLTANGILSKLDEILVDQSVQAAFKLEDEGQLYCARPQTEVFLNPQLC